MRFTDFRGEIFGVINHGKWEEINYIESKSETTRGGHYHKLTLELFFILSGEIQVEIKNLKTQIKNEFIAQKGDAFLVEPYEYHTFYIQKDSAWMNALSLKMEKDTKDFYTEKEADIL